MKINLFLVVYKFLLASYNSSCARLATALRPAHPLAMALLDLLTRQDLEPLSAKLDQLLALHAQAPAIPAEEQLLSVLDVAKYTHFDRKTVEQWVRKGRYNDRGKLVYLPVFEYNGRWRFKRADVEAFGLGIGVLAPTLPGEAPQPVKSTKKASKPAAVVASDRALRVA